MVRILALLGLTGLWCLSVSAKVVYVDKDVSAGLHYGASWADAFADIQSGINAAVSGDQVWVAEGTYTATSDPVVTMKDGVTLYGGFAGTETTVSQRNLYQYSTTISGEGVRRCVTAANASLDGFVLSNGYATLGGGLYMNGLTSGSIVNSSIVYCQGISGGGVYVEDCSATINTCTFYGNSASEGAGMYNKRYTIISISACTFMNNAATSRGGGIYTTDSSQFVVNTVFQGNSATSQGGALYGTSSSGPNLTNCTITENTSANGGGIYNNTSVSTIKNCILWGDTGGEIIDYTLPKSDTKGSTVTYSCVQGGFTGGTSIINADPLFVNTATNNLHLQSGSPCIDVGTASGAPGVDKNGHTRPQGAGYDLGAYEYVPSATLGTPVITTNSGQSFTSTTSVITLSGTCDNASQEIRVNDSPLGVSYSAGTTTWAWSGNLRPGTNTITVIALDSNNEASSPATISITYTGTGVATITSPQGGATLQNTVTITGTATHTDFAAYALYVYATTNDRSSCLLQKTTPVTNGTLAQWDTSSFVGGNYRIILYVWDKGGNVTRAVTLVTVWRSPLQPTADFTATPLSGTTPLNVYFRNTSDPGSNPFTAFAWDFGDGATSTERDPVHTYTLPGTYTVTLSVTTGQGTAQKVREDYVSVLPGPLSLGRITPRIGSTAGGTTVTITGRGFTEATSVYFGTSAATSVSVNSATELTAVTPAHAAGIVSIMVTRPANATTTASAATLSDAFLYTAANAVSGTVQDLFTGSVLAGATCVVSDATTSASLASTTTDTAGRFTLALSDITKRLRLQVSVSGYDTRTIEPFYAPMLFNIKLQPVKPRTPSDLVVLPGTDQVMLYWKPNVEPDLAGYTVYRDGIAVAEGLRVPRFLDTTGIVSGTAYTYRVVAVDTTDNQSDPAEADPVTAGEIELWMPDTAGLPGIPSGGVWVPVNISNARHINPATLSLQITYDATLINAAQVRVEPTGITAHVPFVADTSTEGIIHITSTATAGSEALSGEGNLFSLFLPLRESALTGNAAITVSSVQAYSTSGDIIPVSQIHRTGSIVISALGQLGDLDANGEIDSADITAGFDIVLGRNTAPTSAQQNALDLNGDKKLDAADMVLLERLVAGLPVYPPQTSASNGLLRKDFPLNSLRKADQTATITIPETEADVGAFVEVPVTLDHAEGLSGVGLTISYPAQLILDSINGVSLGTLTAGFTQEANIGTTDVQIAMCNLGALPEGSGSVVVLLFRVSFEAQPGDIFTISVQDVSLKGPYGESFDWTGTVDSTDGTVTVKGIVDLPLVVRVLDNTTHLPIAGSTLAVSQVGGSGSPLITEVADGIFQVMGLETTTYQFFAQATGFTNYTETRGINAAEQSQIDLAMSKSGAGGCHAGALNAPETTSADWADLIQLLLVIGLLLSLRKAQWRCPKN